MYHQAGKGEVIFVFSPCDQRTCEVLIFQDAPCLAYADPSGELFKHLHASVYALLRLASADAIWLWARPEGVDFRSTKRNRLWRSAHLVWGQHDNAGSRINIVDRSLTSSFLR